MEAVLFLRNKLRRHIEWNGQPLTFYRYGKNQYEEIDENVIEKQFDIKGLFHEGGGYGGMLNIELFERDGARTTSKMKPMVLCSYEDGKDIEMDDWVVIAENKYNVVEKVNVKNLNIAYEISLEIDNART